METNKKNVKKVDKKEPLTLNWSAFKRMADLTNHNRNESGVYIWGFSINNIFVPYYVGNAVNLVLRIHEHINAIIGGKYTIYHKDSLLDFKLFKSQKVLDDKSKGKLYNPYWPYGYNTFLENRKELEPHIDFMVDTFTFTFAVVDREKYDLKDVERICINQIGIENLANTREGQSGKIVIKHKGNSTIIKKMKGTNH